NTADNYCFGTCQQSKLFPHFHPPNVIGNKFVPLRGSPHRGPGCYLPDEMTPHAGIYQQVSPQQEKHKQNFAPFNVLVPRFKNYSKDTYYPRYKKPPPKISRPMRFGSPDWAQIPCLQKRTLKAELSTDKDFRKHWNRVAYLSLYYN
uniref:Ciliary microtubule associated protein 3 n=1 Tax=Aotus nancymaae TaxID=37293 RepID=A0A2K5EVA2_AOTNA